MRELKLRIWSNNLNKYAGSTPRTWLSDNKETVLTADSDCIIEQFTGLYDSTGWDDLSADEQSEFFLSRHSKTCKTMDDAALLWKGREIYEGDIIRVDRVEVNTMITGNVSTSEVTLYEEAVGCYTQECTVDFDHGSFILNSGLDKTSLFDAHRIDLMVIGDIHGSKK